jgi:deoxycytidine triphosphate deaminase
MSLFDDPGLGGNHLTPSERKARRDRQRKRDEAIRRRLNLPPDVLARFESDEAARLPREIAAIIAAKGLTPRPDTPL